MRIVSRHGSIVLGAIAFLLVLPSLAQSDDLPATTPAPSAAGSGAKPAVNDQNADNAALAPAPESARATPAPADIGSAASREESAANVATSYTPNMLGDMGGGPTFHVMIVSGQGSKPGTISLQVPSPSSSVLGSQRLADNDCTLPTDRVFCDYSYFHNADLASPSDANRFVPGFEKTFLDGRVSVEMRFPMGVLESNDLVADSSTFGTTGQFGDMQVIVKALLLQNDAWSLGAGLGISIPTAPDLNVGLADGTQLMKIANTSTHLLPYVALLVKPNDDWFAQAFVQFDVAANGDAVSADLTRNGLSPLGDVYDQTLIFADATLGRWLYRNPAQRFSGLAAVVEAHYTGGLNAPSTVAGNFFSVGYVTPSYNVLDLVVGAHAVLGNTTVTLGFATPVTDDRTFDGELRLFVNRRF